MNITKKLLLAATLVSGVNSALANEATGNNSANRESMEQQAASNKMDSAKGWSFSLGSTSFDSEVAFNEGIDDSAFSFDAAYTAYNGKLIYAAGISGMLLSDNESFSQGVTGGWAGNYSTASSTATAFGIFGEIGYSHLFESGYVSLDLLGGMEVIWADRSIASCSNCYSEDINIDSGLYIKPRVTFYKDSGFAFSIAYQKYLSADLEGGVNFNFAWYY